MKKEKKQTLPPVIKKTWWQENKYYLVLTIVVCCLFIFAGIKAAIRMTTDKDPQPSDYVRLKLINVNTGVIFFRELDSAYHVGDMLELVGDSGRLLFPNKAVVIGRYNIKQ